MPESAFAVNVPEAEVCVGRLRELHDPSARLGVPAHITILHPFMSPEQVDAEITQAIRSVLAEARPFAFTLRRIQRLPGVLYLAPEPAAPFIAMTMAFVRRFPAYPPYGGQHAEVIPHLTVAQASEAELDEIEPRLRAAFPAGGIPARAHAIALMENSSGRWLPMHSFALRPPGGEKAAPSP